MDFRAYAEQRRKEAHKEIIFDICMEINNCANCHNDETKKTECCPLNRVELHKVSANSFYICDSSQVKYHHCYTWFRLFLKDGIYSITAVKHNNVNEVVVHKGEIINTKAPIVFQGALQDFENWLHDNQ